MGMTFPPRLPACMLNTRTGARSSRRNSDQRALCADAIRPERQAGVFRKTSSLGFRFVCVFVVFLGVCTLATVPANAEEGSPASAASAKLLSLHEEFERKVAPVVQNYCLDCHAEGAETGGILIDDALSAEQQFASIETWLKAARTQRLKQMPPEDADQPSPEQRQALIDWVEKAESTLDTLEPFDPGPTVFRRLTRRQYNNTMRDLFGIDVDVAARVGLTKDPEAFGYDSIATVLEIPPTQMEKYVAAADEMLDRIIAERALQRSWEAEQLDFQALEKMPADGDDEPPPAIERKDGKLFLRVKSAAAIPIDVPVAGSYRIALYGYAYNGIHWQNYQADVAVQREGKTKKVISFTAAKADKNEKSQERELGWAENIVRLPAGKVELGLRYLNPKHGPKWSSKRFKYLVIERMTVEGPVAASGVEVDMEAHNRIFFAEPAERPRAAAEAILRRFAGRAYRRPVRAEEIDRLMQLYDLSRSRGVGFERSVRPMLKAVLLSPHFLFRIEENRGGQDGFAAHRISDHELAVRLSYFLWGTMPDDELREAADQGRLSDPGVVRQQAERMLDDQRARHLVNDFAVQWLHLEELDYALPSEDNFPKFTAKLRSSMRGEVLMFFEKLIEENRPLTDLIDSDYTYIDRDLALFYRMGHLKHVWREHEIDKRRNSERGGLLGMAGILAMTSHVDRNSPTRRGKWILDVMLGDPPPPPPANVEQIEAAGDKSEAQSFRELLAIHADESSTCYGCHSKMDPLGFALDNFNPIGQWENERNGRKIDASGKLPTGQEVTGVQELRDYLMSEKAKFTRNLAEQMLIYALGRDLDYYDRPSVARIVQRTKENDYKMRELILGIIESYPFQHRRDPERQFVVQATDD